MLMGSDFLHMKWEDRAMETGGALCSGPPECPVSLDRSLSFLGLLFLQL